jgi:hypothetical protein
MARAVEQSGPVRPVVTAIPGIPNNPDSYAKAHPDRVEKFRNFPKERKIIVPWELNQSQDGRWRHELEHDTESVFWLLLYWAMVIQPEKCPKEKIDVGSFIPLNDDHKSRRRLLIALHNELSFNLTHSFYKPLQPLIKDLAAILVIDSHWLPALDPRKDPYYITEAFQRLILKFIIDNRGKEFMDHRVEETFRKVGGIPGVFDGWSSTQFQSLDAAAQEGVTPVGCVCGSMNSCLFLLLRLQGTDDVEMDDIQ